jgi:nucleoside-diphosphate-sugar epimerase
MHVLIIGAAGMIGRKLAARIAADGTLSGQPVDKLTLADIFPPSIPAGFDCFAEKRVRVDLRHMQHDRAVLQELSNRQMKRTGIPA